MPKYIPAKKTFFNSVNKPYVQVARDRRMGEISGIGSNFEERSRVLSTSVKNFYSNPETYIPWYRERFGKEPKTDRRKAAFIVSALDK
jgi:hypothetical protein